MHPLFWQHPQGDLQSPVCPHWVPDHPDGHDEPIPCKHINTVQVGFHWEGFVRVPDFQVNFQHQNDGDIHIPCTHLHQVHPNGNCDFGFCVHPLNPVSRDNTRNIVYYTNASDIRAAVETAFDRLTALGVSTIASSQRPLLIFHHAKALDGGQSDPMWDHYDPTLHAIQIMDGRTSIHPPLRDTVFHEMGHAIVGLRCPQVATLGMPHSPDTPTFQGDAMSEGWADFVSGAIQFQPDDENATFAGRILEGLPSDPLGRVDVERAVARCLWDLYDTTKFRAVQDRRTGLWMFRSIPDDETCALPFTTLFSVFSPTLQTLPAGPLITGINDYINRLIANFPKLRQAINGAFARNFG